MSRSIPIKKVHNELARWLIPAPFPALKEKWTHSSRDCPAVPLSSVGRNKINPIYKALGDRAFYKN